MANPGIENAESTVAIENTTVMYKAAEQEANATGRARRTTQKFGFEGEKADEEEEFKVPVGPGVKVREMEAVAERISHMGKKDTETIKSLYSAMYNRRFQQKNIKQIKEHILDFTGIPDADEKTREQLLGKTGRWMRSYVQDVMDILGIDRSKKSFDGEGKPFDKESLLGRLIEWLVKPYESASKRKTSASPTKKKAKAASASKVKMSSKATAGTKRKATATTSTASKKAKTASNKKKESAENDDATESEHDEDDEDDGSDDADDDSDFDDGTSKKSRSGTSKKTTKTSKTARRSRKVDDEEASQPEREVDDNEQSPLEKKGSLASDVQDKVKEILAQGDVEELTVKKIMRQLSTELGRDLSDEKPAIKAFITQQM